MRTVQALEPAQLDDTTGEHVSARAAVANRTIEATPNTPAPRFVIIAELLVLVVESFIPKRVTEPGN